MVVEGVMAMLKNPDYVTALTLLLATVTPVGTQQVPLSQCAGRVLAQEVTAAEHVPPFDRSAYDGYAFRALDVENACKETPVILRVLEEVPAGAVPTAAVKAGSAVKLLTGAPIPAGADAVIPYELTRFDGTSVTIFSSCKTGSNIVKAGEDVRAGEILAGPGELMDAGLVGTLAAQGITSPVVYHRPVVGIISTGNEVVEANAPLARGKIRDSNRYMLEAALNNVGCEGRFLGLAGDCAEQIGRKIKTGLNECDMVLLTGGVSVGDYDYTPAAMEWAGVEIMVRGVAIKPGMACAYGVKAGRLVCGLSGNPASSITNFYAVVLPAIKKLAGRKDTLPGEIQVILDRDFRKSSPVTRLLRGRLDLSDATPRIILPKAQSNAVLSSTIGCNVVAVVPPGMGPLAAGTALKGFML